MGWRERHQQGSYRGVPFQLETADDERSQRLIEHEFPGRDKPFLEEIGKRPNRFTIEAFLVGDDVLEQRDNLQNACTTPGEGRLIHPYYGELTVKCSRIQTRHDKNELRVVRVSMSFTEVGDLVPIRTAIDTQTRTLTSAQAVLDQQKTAFEQLFDYASLPYSKSQEVLAVLNRGLDDIEKAKGIVGQAAAFVSSLQNIGGALEALVLNAGELADSLIELITFGFLTRSQDVDPEPDLKQSFAGVAQLFEYEPIVSIGSDSTEATRQLFRGASLAQGAHLLSLIEFDSVEESRELSAQLFDAMDSFMLIPGLDDFLYNQMHALRGEIKRDLGEREANLPRIVEMTLPEFIPALVLSYQLYGNVDQENDIIRRNRVRHPGIVPGDIPIKVLTSG